MSKGPTSQQTPRPRTTGVAGSGRNPPPFPPAGLVFDLQLARLFVRIRCWHCTKIFSHEISVAVAFGKAKGAKLTAALATSWTSIALIFPSANFLRRRLQSGQGSAIAKAETPALCCYASLSGPLEPEVLEQDARLTFWCCNPAQKLMAIQPNWKLKAIQPMKTESYPAHETNGGYPAHENWGLSSPWKLRAIQPMKRSSSWQPRAIHPMKTEGLSSPWKDPAHESQGLSSPCKLKAIQPMKTEGFPAHDKNQRYFQSMKTEGYPAQLKTEGYPAQLSLFCSCLFNTACFLRWKIFKGYNKFHNTGCPAWLLPSWAAFSF